MADGKSRMPKIPMAMPNKAPRQKAHKEMCVPRQKPKPKPKPKPKGVEVQEQLADAENVLGYTELRPVRNSVHPYEPLSVDNRENTQPTAEQGPSVPQTAAVKVPANSEVHYANVGSRLPNRSHEIEDSGYENNVTLMRIAQEKKKEDNSSSLQKSDSERHLISSTCLKMFLSVGITVLVVTVIALILLVLASLGLSRAKENTAKYQELQHTAEKMAVKVLVLEEQLNSSVTTNEIIARQMAGKILTLEEQLHSSVTANGNVFDTLERLMEQIRDLYNTQSDLMAKSDVLSRNLSSSTNKLNQTLTSHIITFNGEVDQLNTHIATANSAVGELTDRVDDLNNSLERVENYTKKLSEDTEKLNSTLLQLTSTNNTVPRNCISHINQSTALNTTNVTSPSVDWDSDRQHIDCGAAVYPATPGDDNQALDLQLLQATLRESDGGKAYCECQVLDEYIFNESLVCFMTVTICTP